MYLGRTFMLRLRRLGLASSLPQSSPLFGDARSNWHGHVSQ
jgi:hypothetical protein